MGQKDMSNHLEVKCKICNIIIYNWHVIYISHGQQPTTKFPRSTAFRRLQAEAQAQGAERVDIGFGENPDEMIMPSATLSIWKIMETHGRSFRMSVSKAAKWKDCLGELQYALGLRRREAWRSSIRHVDKCEHGGEGALGEHYDQ